MRKLCLLMITAAAASCGGPKQEVPTTEQEKLVQVGDSSLYLQDVLTKIPAGLDPADSARMFNNIVETWVRNLVLADVAEKNIPDPEKIERMVESYRNTLIVNEYLSSMAEKDANDIPDSRIREYYDSHQGEFILTQPIVKGGFVKLASTDKNLEKVRKWMEEFSDETVDKIEKNGLRQATRYDYFRNDWHDWSTIADQIPYRFGDADAFVKGNSFFETTDGGSTYLLHISDYMPSGSMMPYEYARIKIREILRVEDIGDMRTKLLRDIYRRKIKEGVLKPGLYNPVRK